MPDDFDFSRPEPAEDSAGPPLTTYLLVALSIVATAPRLFPHLLSQSPWLHIYQLCYMSPEEIWSGHYYGMVTTIFAHDNPVHLIFNMLWLLLLGSVLESTIGPLWLVLFVIAAGAAGSGAEMAVVGQPGIGFSGVIYAMFGMMWAARSRFPAWEEIANADNFRWLVGWALFCVVATAFHWMRVANYAHAAGLFFGMAIGFAFLAPRRRLLWLIPLLALIVLTVLAAVWMPWSPYWTQWHNAAGLAP